MTTSGYTSPSKKYRNRGITLENRIKLAELQKGLLRCPRRLIFIGVVEEGVPI